MRLIDADVLLEKYHKTTVWDSWVEINAQPTIDAVKVVRCKDCRKFAPYSDKFKNEHPDSKDGTCMMQAMCGYEWQDARRYAGRYNDDFCSHGERKEADND